MENKPKVAFYWCSSCGGCDEAVVDLAEGFLDLVSAIEIIMWPIALDYKYKDLKDMADNSITVSFINGAIRTEDQENIVKLLRQKSKLIIAMGACAISGGIPSLANLTSKDKIFNRVYHNNSVTADNPKRIEPKEISNIDGYKLTLPKFYETVFKLNDIVNVDYYLPGCSPTSKNISEAIESILEEKLPINGSTLGSNKSLCATCSRNESKPEDIAIKKIKRVIEINLDPNVCFLAQGVICMGPATRDGCEQVCINANMPCTGCYGPNDANKDQGAKMISTLGGIIDADDHSTLEKAIDSIVDPAGTFYRYTLSDSLLGKSRKGDL